MINIVRKAWQFIKARIWVALFFSLILGWQVAVVYLMLCAIVELIAGSKKV